ncbi:hypothetical protein ACN38_g8272 [Penicillium nordicum]|uniref:Uncharacterized protein n=1 Tax=Penicillium nordicum TaxID=229535 RepID=A0A0M9WDQ9_9EURO|nr:hypothetical protein ACN38_g8272 [Penicillium nordicum]
MEKVGKYPAPSTEKKLFKRTFFFLSVRSERHKAGGVTCLFEGGEEGGWEVKQKAAEPTDVEASHPKKEKKKKREKEKKKKKKKKLYLPDYIMGFTIISVLLFFLYKSAYCVLLVQGDLPDPCSP